MRPLPALPARAGRSRGLPIPDPLRHRELDAAISETDRLDPHWRLAAVEADRAAVPDAKNSAIPTMAAKAHAAQGLAHLGGRGPSAKPPRRRERKALRTASTIWSPSDS